MELGGSRFKSAMKLEVKLGDCHFRFQNQFLLFLETKQTRVKGHSRMFFLSLAHFSVSTGTI